MRAKLVRRVQHHFSPCLLRTIDSRTRLPVRGLLSKQTLSVADSGQIEYDMNHFSFPRSFPRECPARLKFRNMPTLMTIVHSKDTWSSRAVLQVQVPEVLRPSRHSFLGLVLSAQSRNQTFCSCASAEVSNAEDARIGSSPPQTLSRHHGIKAAP